MLGFRQVKSEIILSGQTEAVPRDKVLMRRRCDKPSVGFGAGAMRRGRHERWHPTSRALHMLIYGAIPDLLAELGWQSASSGSPAVGRDKRRTGRLALSDKAIAAVAA